MTRMKRLGWAGLALGALGLSAACASDGGNTSTDQRVRRLADSDKDGLLREIDPEPDECIILPEPGDCPVMSWTETHTVTTDAMGNVISETYSVCTQCFEEDGVTPIGDEVCYEEPPVPYRDLARRLGLATGSIGFIRGRCLKNLQRALEKAGF